MYDRCAIVRRALFRSIKRKIEGISIRLAVRDLLVQSFLSKGSRCNEICFITLKIAKSGGIPSDVLALREQKI